ncbi:hypothetical protein [Eikenella sp. Marseille-P7795]|uniref:hypothetical protein n=1 Tax=Eikenella sp. Marseille-P7795 TaxID=2866577 RepID=UPI001CE448D4|nr:hypothetical protein [Eikenella sp. Marseille-P7795]
MNKLFSIVAAALLLAACNPSQNNSQNSEASAPPAASGTAQADSQQPPALALPLEAQALEAAAAKAVEGYQPAAEKQLIYFDRDSKPADKPSPGGYYREILGTMPDGRLVVQDFYQDSGKPQILPALLVKDGDPKDFSTDINDSLVVWKDEDGSISSAGEFAQGKLNGWLGVYRNGRLAMQGRDTEPGLENEVLFLYADGKPMMWIHPAADKQHVIMNAYYPGGGIMVNSIGNANGEGQPVISAWDKQGKPAPVAAIKEDWETIQSSLAELQEHMAQHDTVMGSGQSASAPK